MENMQPGDACEECLNQGINNKLRYFYINLEEQLLKCESRYCLWPHNDEVSSDEEDDASASAHETSNVDDDDEFIVQMLQQLAAETGESATESVFATETLSMPDITAPVVESTPAAADVDMINQPRDLIIEPLARGQCISPKSIPLPSLSNNDKLLSAIITTAATTTAATTTAATTTATYSPPDLQADFSGISKLPEQKELSIPDIKFSVSELNGPNGSPQTQTNEPPKTYLFRAPKKASTFIIKEKPKIVEPVPSPSPAPPSSRCSAILSKLLDGEKRGLEMRPVRGRLKRSGLPGSRSELRQQLRQSIKAKQTGTKGGS